MSVEYKTKHSRPCPNCGGTVMTAETQLGLRGKCQGDGDPKGCKFNGILDPSKRTKRAAKGGSSNAPPPQPPRTENEPPKPPAPPKPVAQADGDGGDRDSSRGSGKRGDWYDVY